MKAPIKVTFSTNQLSEATKMAMWEVYQPYYHYSKSDFLERINRNTHYSFYSVDGKIIGFTGLRINKVQVKNRKHLLVYFGQTVISETFRGYSLLPRTALLIVRKYWKAFLCRKVFFWADSLTYKAYLVFAKYLKEYYPSYHGPNSESIKQLVQFIGETYYKDTFNPDLGTIQKDTVWVNDRSCRMIPSVVSDPDIAFYISANPDNQSGHGLLTLGPMHLSNMLHLVKRTVTKQFKSKKQLSTQTQGANQ